MTTSPQDRTSQSDGAADGGKPDIDQLQADIEHTRAELGQTVEALTAKLDVKTRAKAKASDTKQKAAVQLRGVQAKAGEATQKAVVQLRGVQAKATTDDGKPVPAVYAGAGVAAALVALATALVMWRKRR